MKLTTNGYDVHVLGEVGTACGKPTGPHWVSWPVDFAPASACSDCRAIVNVTAASASLAAALNVEAIMDDCGFGQVKAGIEALGAAFDSISDKPCPACKTSLRADEMQGSGCWRCGWKAAR